MIGSFISRRKMKLPHYQPMKQSCKDQSKRYAQERIHHAQNHRSLKSVNSSPQHQSAKAIHRCLIPVIHAKAQAQASQRPHQRMNAFSRHHIKGCQNRVVVFPEYGYSDSSDAQANPIHINRSTCNACPTVITKLTPRAIRSCHR